jgi:hypothetical protein
MWLILQLGHVIWLSLLNSIMAVQTITPLLAMVSDQTLSRKSVGNWMLSRPLKIQWRKGNACFPLKSSSWMVASL